jgi:O-Antigen ligase
MQVDEGSRSAEVGRSGIAIPVELIPGLVCLAAFIAWAIAGGGFSTVSSGAGGLFLIALLAVVVIAVRPRLASIPVPVRVAFAFLAAFVAWNFLSIAWADDQGIAWDGANRALIYLTVFAIFALLAWRTRSIAIVMGAFAVALAIIAAVEVQAGAEAEDPLTWFIGGRFAEPANYANAVAALFIGGFWPALFLGSRRETPWALRGVLLGVAALLLEVALMTQSRGFVIVLPIAIAIFFVAVSNRLRSLLFLLLVGAAAGAAAPAILDVFTVAEHGGDIATTLGDARDAMLISVLALAVVGTAIGFADRAVEIPRRVERVSGRVAAAVLVALALAGAVVGLTAIGNVADWSGDRWDDFKGGYSERNFARTRFSGDLGSNRYDFWRVAIEDQVADAPLVGQGSDNYAATYLVNRKSEEDPLYPHSLPIRILGGTGIVGLLLFAGFSVSVLIALLRARAYSGSLLRQGLIGTAIAAAAYVALHSSGDWLWSFPAIAAPAFAWLGLASRPDPELTPMPDADPTTRRGVRIGLAIVASGLALLAFVSVALPWLAASEVQIATGGWGSDPEAALDRLDTARGLDFLSAEPDLTAGAIASAIGDRRQVRESFRRALSRDPENWYALLEIGAVAGLEGRRQEALATLDRAAGHNPREPLIREAARRIRGGDPMTLHEIDDRLLAKVCEVVGRTNETTFCN